MFCCTSWEQAEEPHTPTTSNRSSYITLFKALSSCDEPRLATCEGGFELLTTATLDRSPNRCATKTQVGLVIYTYL